MPWSVWGFNTLGIVSLYIMLCIAGRRGGRGGCVLNVRGTECRVLPRAAPPPPWINGKAARIRADSPSSLGFAPLSVRCATSSSAVSLSSATTILVSSRSLSDCYFISRVHAARKSVKISFPRLLIFACVAMSAAVAANKRKSW
jgi:hypothetical protein